ncbi:hypothetical protein ABT369_09425 [Dactylosporangium sp. NPDC000244]|uniref:hypothetical protein n=1 Tax=Dactylosporangium sp. NPDC000244 TaxID=3154365 RepID=UPI00332D3584
MIGHGGEALDHLRRTGAFRDAPVPNILLLVVVVLTGSGIEERMLREFGVPAAYFFRKPVDFAQFAGICGCSAVRASTETRGHRITQVAIAEARRLG